MHNPYKNASIALRQIPTRPSWISVQIISTTDAAPPVLPVRLPRKAKLVCQCSSTYGPAHSSEDAFLLSTNAIRSHWILWHGYFDDNESMRWIFQPVAICRYSRVPIKAAAFYLLVGLLQRRECFEQVLNCIRAGILNEPEIHLAIALTKSHMN